MPFELPPLPSFQTNIAQNPSPLDQYGKMLQLKSLAGQQSLLPLQQQEAAARVTAANLSNQKEQLALDSQKKLMEAISSGAFNKYAGVETPDGTGFDAKSAFQDLVANHGVLPDQASAAVNSLLTIAKNQADIAKTGAQTGEANAAVRAKTLEQLAAKLGSINDMTLEKAGPALDAFKKDLVNNSKAYPGMTQQELAELYGADLSHLPAMESLLGLEGKIADFHKSKAENIKAQQGIINPESGMSPEQEAEATKTLAVETNPKNVAAKASIAAAEGQARANVEAAMARGSNAALANVPPHLIGPASAAAEKAGADYAQSKMVSDNIAAIMEAAKKGNVVSYQLLPQEGALQVMTTQGVHRINMAEIANYGGGSLFQRLEGHIGKQLTGKSIPDSVLNDMADVQDVYRKGSRAKYENTLATVNQTYGSTFKPVEMALPKAEPKTINYKFVNGQLVQQ